MQWYPFTKKSVRKELLSDDFYNHIIKSGYFLFDKQVMEVTSNYIQKSDGTYRQSQLLSPLLSMILESICKEIFILIDGKLNNSHALYAGDLGDNSVTYSKQYNLFYKEVNKLAGIFPFYMKFDINNFFRNIDINLLFSMIEEKTNKIPQFHIYIYKQFFEFIGQGKFPVVENSTGLSYLATKIYLNDIDEEINNFFIRENITMFTFIRYVDDLYIFIDPEIDGVNPEKLFNKFKHFYTTNLRDLNLNINSQKSTLNESKDINQSLKKSFYMGEIYEEDINLHDIPFQKYELFLKKLVENLESNGTISIDDYDKIKNEVFNWPDIELSVEEAYNTIVYNFSDEFINNTTIIDSLNKLLEDEVILFDVKRFVVAILHTKEGTLIKKLLNTMFRKKYWNDSDNYIAITYLLQRSFAHSDLKKTLQLNLEDRNPGLFNYIEAYCKGIKSWKRPGNELFIKKCKSYNISTTTMHLYFLYLKAKADDDALLGHAYFKTLFDRITAELSYSFGIEVTKRKSKKIVYNNFYEEKILSSIYGDYDSGGQIIKRAHKIRNSNPIIHSSSELAKGSRTKEDIINSIEDLKKLIKEFIRDFTEP